MSNPMILENKGITIGQYFIPPFDLRDGEIVVLFLYGGPHFQDLAANLTNIFTGKNVNDAVHLNQPLTYVPHFSESFLRKHFYPLTVGEYIKKNAGKNPLYTDRIYHFPISKRTKMNTLSHMHRQLLSLYATLSHTNHIVFDLAGQGPEGADAYYHVVKEIVKQGGAALLLDYSNDMKNDCTKYIELQVLQ